MIESAIRVSAFHSDCQQEQHLKSILVQRLQEDIASQDSSRVVHGLLVMIRFIDWIGGIGGQAPESTPLLAAIKHHLGNVDEDAKEAALIRKQCRFLVLHAAR